MCYVVDQGDTASYAGETEHCPTLTCAFGVHHSLWDPLPVKVCHLVSEDHILDQKRAPGSCSLQVQLVSNRMASPGGQSVWPLT